MAAVSRALLPAALYFVASVFGAFGQYLYKQGAARLTSLPLWRNWPLWAGIASFCVVMVLFVAAYRLGGRIITVYPVYATTFVWGALLGVLVDHERFAPVQFAGLALVLVGVGVVALGAPH